jgi:hypothetical protein
MAQRLVKNSWNKKHVEMASKLILSSLKWQILGSGRVGNSIFVSFHSNKFMS